MARLALIKDGLVVNVIEVDCDTAVMSETAGPGDSYDPVTQTFTRPE